MLEIGSATPSGPLELEAEDLSAVLLFGLLSAAALVAAFSAGVRRRSANQSSTAPTLADSGTEAGAQRRRDLAATLRENGVKPLLDTGGFYALFSPAQAEDNASSTDDVAKISPGDALAIRRAARFTVSPMTV